MDDGDLLHVSAEKYGSHYQDHVLEQYKLFVEMADKVSERRQIANNHFLTINTVLLSLFGVLAKFSGTGTLDGRIWNFLVPFVGLLVCFIWIASIKSFRQLSSGKFRIIHELESALPAALFSTEWVVLGKGKGEEYTPTTHVEKLVVWIFAGLYVLLMFFGLLSLF